MLDYRRHALPYLNLFKGIKLLVLDNDGIMTTGQVHYYDEGTSIGVTYGVLDGYSMARLFKFCGVRVAIVSGRKNGALLHRCKVLNLNSDDVYIGVVNKAEFLGKLMEKYNLTKDEVAYMGDDQIDISAFKVVGLPISVPNRHPMVTRYVKYITLNESARGAVREVCDLIQIANNDTVSEMGKELISFWNSPLPEEESAK